jgi:hypothetical protein
LFGRVLSSAAQKIDFPALNNLRRNLLKRDRIDPLNPAASSAFAIIVFLWVINAECAGDYSPERANIFG